MDVVGVVVGEQITVMVMGLQLKLVLQLSY